MTAYRIHSMHGPTVKDYERLTDGLAELWRLQLSNGGPYRLVDERTGRQIASLDTYATYAPLCHERNAEKTRPSSQTKTGAAEN